MKVSVLLRGLDRHSRQQLTEILLHVVVLAVLLTHFRYQVLVVT